MERKYVLPFVLTFLLLIGVLVGCAADPTVSTASTAPPEPAPQPTYMAELYDNHGNMWLNIEGNYFDIEPNKVKQYGYSSGGGWDWWYETSSIVSISVDGHNVESCGSTALFYDTRLKKVDIDFPSSVNIATEDSNAILNTPNDLRFTDYWGLHWWWSTKKINSTVDKRLVVIQSQEGDPICMFEGNKVSWDIPTNLPKTTEINIDGKLLYVHRANFSIIDTSIFAEVVNE